MAEYSKAIFTIYMMAIIAFTSVCCYLEYDWENTKDDSEEEGKFSLVTNASEVVM